MTEKGRRKTGARGLPSRQADESHTDVARLEVIVAELEHRARNLLAIVQAIANRTVRDTEDLAGFAAAFSQRLAALARAHTMLSDVGRGKWVMLDELIAAELEALAVGMDDQRDDFALRGPPGVRLRADAIQILALALHELATNAVKYGALNQPGARLDIHWSFVRREHGARLHLEWLETGLRRVEPVRSGTGFGRELIERILPRRLGAETSFVLSDDRLRCTVLLPSGAAERRRRPRRD